MHGIRETQERDCLAGRGYVSVRRQMFNPCISQQYVQSCMNKIAGIQQLDWKFLLRQSMSQCIISINILSLWSRGVQHLPDVSQPPYVFRCFSNIGFSNRLGHGASKRGTWTHGEVLQQPKVVDLARDQSSR